MSLRVFAKGRHAVGICMRSGRKMLLRDMVFDGEYPWMRVDPDWKEDKHPQERLRPKPDPIALRKPAPDVDKTQANVIVLQAVIDPSLDLENPLSRHSPMAWIIDDFTVEAI